MKKAILCGALSAGLLTTPVLAGSLSDPVVPAPVVVEDVTSSSSGETLVLLLAILMTVPLWD